ncbi:TPA: phage protein NinX family protein [Morganella morganii]
MNKCRDKSDFEINKAVFRAARIKHKWFRFLPHGVVTYNIKGDWLIFDPCNNPADAMPIVIENGISSLFNDDEWICSVPYTEFLSINESLYRAAMEVFLMMKDAENEKV